MSCKVTACLGGFEAIDKVGRIADNKVKATDVVFVCRKVLKACLDCLHSVGKGA